MKTATATLTYFYEKGGVLLDFVRVKKKQTKNDLEISPGLIVRKSKDLMIRGHSFYAFYNPKTGLWTQDEDAVIDSIDNMINDVYTKMSDEGIKCHALYLWDSDSGKIDAWHKYCQKQMSDNYHALNQVIEFSNSDIKKTDYATFKLPYDMIDGPTPAWDELTSLLYSDEERRKIEYAIGSIVSGKSKEIQKFYVFYGSAGTGKSTILNIIQGMFEGYWSTFDASSLTSKGDSFALEDFNKDPLLSIQHDGDLSRIDDNTKLNSVVSHETLTVNEKFKSKYESRFNTTLFIGTNKPVRITDAKSGLLRRLIDISPTGYKIPKSRYDQLIKQVKFEYGAIAYKCLKVFNENPGYYDKYTPNLMFDETNDFYNFMEEQYPLYSDMDKVSLASAWNDYKSYVQDANLSYSMSKRVFKNELRNYFDEFYDGAVKVDGKTYRNLYSGFKRDKFHQKKDELGSESIGDKRTHWLKFDLEPEKSEFDLIFQDQPAQYANDDGNPTYRWQNVKSVLHQLDPHRLHWVKVPENLVVIDFDCTDETGEKNLEVNMQAVKDEWFGPPTYAEISKSGQGIHLIYIYDGDTSQLVDHIGEHIEVKVYRGNSALRRKLGKCNNLPIAHINSGIPFKEEKINVLNWDGVKTESILRKMVLKNLNKEYHADTSESINFIKALTDDAYNRGIKYDISDLRGKIQSFAYNTRKGKTDSESNRKRETNIRIVSKIHFKSDEMSADEFKRYKEEDPIVFFDVEVFPNVFIVCWKPQNSDTVIQMINPSADDIKRLCQLKLIGFNNRDYDNHIMYAWMQGYTNYELYILSKRIISGDAGAKIGSAYNLSYSDVFDFLASYNKMSLKKWEIVLDIPHIENEYDWNSDLPKEHWQEVADYCSNDVKATQAVFEANYDDWLARLILADLADMSPNTTTNNLTAKIIFGDDPHPQSQFVYTDLSTIFPGYEFNEHGIDKARYKPGAKIVSGKSIYMGEDPGEGGHKIAIPGFYRRVGLFDVASMHPHSAIKLGMFGPKYTKRYEDLVNVRIDIKHHDHSKAETMFDGKLKKWLDNPDISDKKLANALKTAINSVYGLTSAHFDNKFKDPRNVDNIVAKYGALFMINLKHELYKMGYQVVHISTDSIKVADVDQKAYDFIMAYGKKYGYDFEYEAHYDRMCIVNDAVYIALEDKADGEPVEPFWTATGKEFAVPYVFKTLFSHESLQYRHWNEKANRIERDFSTTMSVKTSLYLDMNEELDDNSHAYQFIGRVGSFVPIAPGKGGGILLRQDKADKNKFTSATGSKGYRWLESTMVDKLTDSNIDKVISLIDLNYFEDLANKAKEHISEFVDFNDFVNGKAEPEYEIQLAA